MPTIRLTTLIDAPVQRCFLLSLSVDFLNHAAVLSGDRPLTGVTSGLLHVGQSITSSGRHLGRRLEHTSLLDIVRPCTYFHEIMTHGTFASFEHEHHFAPMNDGTRIRDDIRYDPPSGLLHRFTRRRLEVRLRSFFATRNVILKQVAESEVWHRFLDGQLDLAPPDRAAATVPSP